MGSCDPKTVTIHELTLTSPPEDIEEARTLLLEYGGWVIAQPGAGRFCFGSLQKEAENLPAGYLEQDGGCMMARADREPAGFVAWRTIPPPAVPDALVAAPSRTAWELKRLWVRNQARGLGLGRILTEAVIERARNAARQSIYLDTAPQSMGAAYRMYLSLGFVPCDRYNDNPVEGLAYLVKHL